ncbi:TadE/TadG family type IV pilus assembly protein [Sphingomonas montana]|uniref:TadE/TadG family type IV pilus assembly protein n=1 Tax=Sphingomonas montana TaxID=1843236 RepID=UPI00096C7BDB|nr:hypothetical protein [Sphingomonas montana]
MNRLLFLCRRSRRILADRAGVALIEFGLSLPIIMALGIYGAELANFALINMKISQIALNLSDNASRVGLSSGLAQQQLREYDINDVFQASRLQGKSFDLIDNGRITLSSLETDEYNVQRIHWQRCLGNKTGTGFDSTYGTTSATAGSDASIGNAGTLAPLGMGPVNAKVSAPPQSGVMFVEINYAYEPLFAKILLGNQVIRYTASYIVRDRRDFSQIFNPAPKVTAMTCTQARS